MVVIDLSFISIPVIIFLLVFTCMYSVYTPAIFLKGPSIKRKDAEPLISIIIPANNEEGVIEQCIRNFARQTYKKLELIVVCHNCTDNTYPIAKRVAESVSGIAIKIIDFKTKEAGKGIALNCGLEAATGDLVAYFDADGTTNDEFFKNALKYIDSGFHCLQAKLGIKNPDNILAKLQGYEMQIFSTLFCEGRFKLGLNSGICGTGVVIKTAIIRAIGGFGNSLVDDLDICMKLTKRGYKIAFANDCIVYDEKPLTWSGAFKQRTRWYAGHINVLFDKFTEVLKRPHDLLYLLAPLAIPALWISLTLGVFYAFQIYILKTVLFVFYGITLKMLVVLTVIPVIQVFLVLAHDEGKLKALRTTMFYMVPLYCWTFVWYIVVFKAIRVKSWATTKTTHIGGESG
jgi:cellulose synthase/poly-beta-1,6-N-acetylglucosamine synthase-like glycosyltransferase